MAGAKQSRFIAPTRRYGAGKNKPDLSILILAGSMGYKMKSYGPRSLIKLSSGQTVLDHQLSVISLAYPHCEIILSIGFEADKILKNCPAGIRIVENQLYETTNILEEARLGLNNCTNDNVLILGGEVLFNLPTIDKITSHNCSTVIVDDGKQLSEEDVGVTIVKDKATIFSYGITPRWGHIVYLTGKELRLMKNVVNDRDKNKLYLFEALNLVLDKNGSFKAYYPDKAEMKKIDSAKDII